jgi:hypothetical protein
MIVQDINWEIIPNTEHNRILQLIPKGSYISSLPFNTDRDHFKIPVLSSIQDVVVSKADDMTHDVEIMRFARETVYKDRAKTTVWRKE